MVMEWHPSNRDKKLRRPLSEDKYVNKAGKIRLRQVNSSTEMDFTMNLRSPEKKKNGETKYRIAEATPASFE